MKRLTVTALAILICYAGFSCTSFILREGNNAFLAKNFDYFTGEGFLFINQRNDIKTGACIPPEKPSQWISKYGSISFNLYGKDLPMSGMNEKGLIIESLWLDGTKYPLPDERMAVPELGWIQFMLDNCSTIDEVMEFDKQIRIANTSMAEIHFILLDSKGNSAVFEMVDGKTRITKGEYLNPEVLENQLYSKSLDWMNDNPSGLKSYTLPITDKRERFEMVSQMIADKQADCNPVNYSFSILQKVTWTAENEDAPTHWSIVYESNNRSIHFKTKVNTNIKTIALSDFDFECSDYILTANMNVEAHSLKAVDFEKYNLDEAKKSLKQVFDAVPFTKGKIPDVMIDEIINATGKKGCDN
jgi:choloylglycine hydrolase